jgi:molybdopterin-containing oxidoreductase family iron-sulfur binding subunit
MTIDMNACVGCNNCIVACQLKTISLSARNGRRAAIRTGCAWMLITRAMRQLEGILPPVPCMQCENAPRTGLSVGATVHGSEGLNDMVYNRCIGTRYRSNNCPYKCAASTSRTGRPRSTR